MKRLAGRLAGRPRAAVAVVLLVLVVSGCSVLRHASYVSAPPVHQARRSPPSARLPFYLGVYETGEQESYAPIAQFASATGHDPQIALVYRAWNRPFPTEFAQRVRAHGTMPLIQIDPSGISLQAIAAGHYDTYLVTYARQARAFGSSLAIGFGHEMNGRWYSWGWSHVSPSTWVAAWRHVVDVFRSQHATNVVWLWTISRHIGRRFGPARVYWPGSSYVTWVGIDGYYTDPSDTFKSVFGVAISAVRRFTRKPILLSEAAVGRQTRHQARDISELFAGIRSDHLRGLVWFDVAQDSGLYHQDWRLEGDASALAAFRRGLASLRNTG